MTHELKIYPKYFERVTEGAKTFETRKNDRDFQAGDTVILEEFNPNPFGDSDGYTGRTIEATIGYVLHELQLEGYVTFSLIELC